ncbi:hypothetical protein E4T48_02937 [Aureobasidium sp. EXF-10727]|nr:hypothetical protein E4T48_02937 [Aureobasidium sp. EXF-10727]
MAAAKLCCTAPLPSQSPDDTPSRPVRHFKSLANIKTHFAHNKHAPATTDHAERSHPLYSADDLELQRIFVAASLPADHPHALRIAHRKPEVDESIVHSPSFTNKLRRQLSRKSLVTDKLHTQPTSKSTVKPFAHARKRFGHGLPDLAGDYDDDARSLCLTESRLASLKNDSCAMTDAKPVQHIWFPESVNHYATVSDEPRRIVISSMELGRCKSISISGFAGPAGPSTWEKVLEDESSSIYSRRPSMALESPLEAPMEHSSDISEKTLRGDVLATNVSELTNRGKENTIGQAERVISASTGISFVASGSASHSDLRDSASSRKSLVNYERSLSIVGNNRRRKSTLGGPKIQAQGHEHQDDYPERTLRRASPLLSPGRKGTEETLMERALLQHQAEKAALLRPSSQRNEIVPSPMYAPVFTSPFGFQSTSETRLAAATLEDLDPLEPEEPQAARGSQAARNRRSSTATGGRLEHPELEVLPPMLPTHPTSSQRLGAKDQLARPVNHVEEEGHHIGNEGLGFIHRHRQESTSSLDKSPSGHDPPVPGMYDASQIVHDQEAGDLEPRDYTKDKSILPGSVDGNIESRPAEPDRALSARRLSRMYQAYVQLPVSSENTEVEQAGATDDVGQVSDGPTTVESAETDPKTPNTEFLAVPSGKQAVSSGSITRHFPSVTVVDDRKGHWRSVSLLSVDSGKSVRKSTRDLLEVVRATQTQELEKLLGTSELSMMDETTL